MTFQEAINLFGDTVVIYNSVCPTTGEMSFCFAHAEGFFADEIDWDLELNNPINEDRVFIDSDGDRQILCYLAGDVVNHVC